MARRKPVPKSAKGKVRRHNATGPKPLWDKKDIPRLSREVEMLVSQHGWTDGRIAEFYDITERTLYRYKVRYPEFARAMVRGEDQVVKMVEGCLVQSATGFMRKSLKIMQHEGEPVLVEFEEHVNPSVQAQVAYLRAKNPKEYNDRLIHTGDPKEPVQFIIVGPEVDYSNLGEEHGKPRQPAGADTG